MFPSDENPLRNRLRAAHPELFDALQRSWSIAINKWLPAIAPNGGSLNSLPHLHNLENQVARLEQGYREFHGTDAQSLFSPAEIYLILSCILFHDIGKSQPKAKGDHGKRSATTIRNAWAELGIPDRHWANMIANIAECHSAEPGSTNVEQVASLDERLRLLTTRAIDPYGEIREHSCAALLILVDNMDATFRRVVPDYTFENGELGRAAKFRLLTGDVVADLRGRVVRVILDDAANSLQSLEARPEGQHSELADDLLNLGREVVRNREVLRTIQSVLSATGVSLRGWVVEYDGMLYVFDDPKNLGWWTKTYEPAFSISYLRRITETMWELSSRIFGEGYFSYETLADAMREPIPERARRAVKRIAVVASCLPNCPFWYSPTHWRWVASEGCGKDEDSEGLRLVLAQIETLADSMSVDRKT